MDQAAQEELTFIKNPQNYKGFGGASQDSSRQFALSSRAPKLPKSFLDSNLYYPDAHDNFPFGDFAFSRKRKAAEPLRNPSQLSSIKKEDSRRDAKAFKFEDHLLDDTCMLDQQEQSESLNFTHTSWNDETMLKMLNLEESNTFADFRDDHDEDAKTEEDPEETSVFDAERRTLRRSLARNSNLKNILNFIYGDLYHCAVCSAKFEERRNVARVLFCGDCLCESCLRASIAASQATSHT